MWIKLRRAHPLGRGPEARATRRAARGGRRGARRDPEPAPARPRAALADWGKAHRFAGSGDRSAIGNLVYDALRRKSSIAAQMGADTPRALALGAAPRALGLIGRRGGRDSRRLASTRCRRSRAEEMARARSCACRRMRRRDARATSPTGCCRRLSARSARRGRGRRGAERARARRPARQHAQGRRARRS